MRKRRQNKQIITHTHNSSLTLNTASKVCAIFDIGCEEFRGTLCGDDALSVCYLSSAPIGRFIGLCLPSPHVVWTDRDHMTTGVAVWLVAKIHSVVHIISARVCRGDVVSGVTVREVIFSKPAYSDVVPLIPFGSFTAGDGMLTQKAEIVMNSFN